jgi:hypothetical protein
VTRKESGGKPPHSKAADAAGRVPRRSCAVRTLARASGQRGRDARCTAGEDARAPIAPRSEDSEALAGGGRRGAAGEGGGKRA